MTKSNPFELWGEDGYINAYVSSGQAEHAAGVKSRKHRGQEFHVYERTGDELTLVGRWCNGGYIEE